MALLLQNNQACCFRSNPAAAPLPLQGDIWVDAVLSKGGDVVAVSVHDTGIGVPAHKLDDIFAPFAQVRARVCVCVCV
jgi:signal transduction histidine kinase